MGSRVAPSLILATTSVAGLVVIGLWGMAIHPDRPLRWAFVAGLLPAAWAAIEAVHAGRRSDEIRAIMRWHRAVIGFAALLFLAAEGSRLAIEVGLLSASDGSTIQRMRGLALGFGLATWGNLLPKLRSPWPLVAEPFDWQGVHRFCGRLAFATGAALIAIWVTLPIETAERLSFVGMAIFALLSLARKTGSLMGPRSSSPAPPRDDVPVS